MEEGRNYFRKRSYVQDSYAENEGCKRRNLTGQSELQDHRDAHTVYRYLCPNTKAGRVIGRGGEIMKYLRENTGARVVIEDAIQGCEERIVTISSSSKETNPFVYKKNRACPAQDALFRVHERLIEHDPLVCNPDDSVFSPQFTARLLIPSDQARCIIGRHGYTIQNMRKNTRARINIWNYEKVPVCANNGEELLEINGDAFAVKAALFQISCLLHENPSPLHDCISSNTSYNAFGCHLIGDTTTRPCLQAEEWCDFTLRLVCPSLNIREVIGTGGTNINQIRQESGATINLDCFFEEEDCIILISAKEPIGNSNSPTTSAATHLLPGCSRKVERKYGEPLYLTRMLVLKSQVGRLIGKGGLVIKNIRRTNQADITILEDSLPCVASADDAMIQISGDLSNVRGALIQVIDRLKAIHTATNNLFSASTSASSHYMPRSPTRGSVYTGRTFELRSQGHSSSTEYGASVGRAPLEITGCGGSQVDGEN